MQTNHPDYWHHLLPAPRPDGHKYDRGHALVYGAEKLTGATRLAATACSRIGAGLTTVHAVVMADIYRATLPPDIMVTEDDPTALRRVSAVLAGPGGIDIDARSAIFSNPWNASRVLDAGCLPLPHELNRLDTRSVITPHEGEFRECFPDIEGSREIRCTRAAELTGAIVALKGAQTIIADPSGNVMINRHASPYLAKAGTGDVLAGMITGLIAQGMPCFEAACAAVWMHGDAGARLGIGQVASDIERVLPAILGELAG